MNDTSSRLTRRGFLRSIVLSGTAAALGAACVGGPGRAGSLSPKPCSPGNWRKQGIVLEATEPWEGDSVQNFTCRAEPLEEGRWRLWYSVSGSTRSYNVAFAEGRPGGPMRKTLAICSAGEPADGPLAIGNLPEAWKPVQAVHLRLVDGRHRLYFWAHGPQICRYLAAESEDGRRYRVLDPLRPVLYHPSDRAAFGVLWPDGVMFRGAEGARRPADEPQASSGLISNDATNVYLLPDGTFEIYTVGLVRVPRSDPAYVAQDNAPGLLRVIDRLTSGDGLHFENRKRVVQRDADDPVDQQFYYLALTFTPKGRVGMLGHYRCGAQTMDLEWCFSRDGVAWERPLRRAWIARGAPPAPDCYGIYAPGQLVQHAGQWHLFYTAVNHAHNGRHSYGRPRQVVMHATADCLWA